MQQGLRRRAAIAATALITTVVAGVAASTAQAVTIDVSCNDPNRVTALRNAINVANTNANNPTVDVINVTNAPCDFVFTNVSFNGGTNNSIALPLVSAPLKIQGNDARLLRDAAAPPMRLVYNNGAALTLERLTIEGGRLSGTGNTLGGNVVNAFGTLTLDRTRILGGQVAGTGQSQGGGLYTLGGSVTATDSEIAGNQATQLGGGLLSNATVVSLTGTTIKGNTAVAGGGTYALNGSLTMNGGAIDANQANAGGGLVAIPAPVVLNGVAVTGNKAVGTAANQGVGGAIHSSSNSNVAITGGTLGDNTAAVQGGAVYAVNGTTSLTGTEIEGNEGPHGGGFSVSGGSLALHDVDAHDNEATAANGIGGAIVASTTAITVDQGSTLTGNSAVQGGAIYTLFNAVNVSDTTLSGNSAPSGGGAIYGGAAAVTVKTSTLSANHADAPAVTGLGGALFTNGGTLTVEDSTVADNTAYFLGGGFYGLRATVNVRRSTVEGNVTQFSSGAALWQGGTATVENSTIDGNTAAFAIGGLGVTGAPAQGQNPAQGGTLNVVSSTLADNGKTASTAPGNQLVANGQDGGATINVTDTIVSDESAGPADAAACTVTNGGTIANGGGNLEWPGTTCGFGTPADPDLDPLGSNGGPTETRRPRPTSAAIDRGGADGPATDQRGVSRPDGDGFDAGSYETPAPETSAQGPASPTNDPEVTFSSDDASATFECKVDDGDFNPCTSPFEPTLTTGGHTVAVRAVNEAGYADPSPALVGFTVDVTAPVVDVTSVVQQAGQPAPAKATFSVDDTATTVECQVDDGPRVPCSEPEYVTPGLGDGSHTVTVYASDALGNEASDSGSVLIDTAPPETTVTSGPSGTIYNKDSATYTFTSSKPNSTFECRVNSGPWTACTSPKTFGNLAPGTYTFAFRATDQFGATDPTPATRTVTFRKCLVYVNVGSPVCIGG